MTVLRLRFRTPQAALAQLFGVVTGTISKAERETRPLLDQHGYIIEPTRTPLKTLTDLYYSPGLLHDVLLSAVRGLRGSGSCFEPGVVVVPAGACLVAASPS